MKKIVQFITVQGNYHIALLILRIWLGISLFVDHGIEKLNFNQMARHFPDPLHIGVIPGLLFAFVTDVICSILVALGLFTRIAALLIVINLSIAFVFFHKVDITNPLGQVAYIYLGAYLTILVAGPGKYSVDSALFKSQK